MFMKDQQLSNDEIEAGRVEVITEILNHPLEAPLLVLLGLDNDRMQVIALPVSDRDMANAISAMICSFAYQQTTFSPGEFLSAMVSMVHSGIQTGIAMRIEREQNPTGVQH
jgi:hypothetical protein